MAAVKRGPPGQLDEPAKKRVRSWKTTGFHDPRRQDRTDSQIMDLIETTLPGVGPKVKDAVHDGILGHVFKMSGTSLADFYVQLDATVDKKIPEQLRAVQPWLKPGIAMAAKDILDQVKRNGPAALGSEGGPELYRQLANAEPLLREVTAQAGIAPGLSLADASQARHLVEARLHGAGNLIVSEVMGAVIKNVEGPGQESADKFHSRLEAVAGKDPHTQWGAVGADLQKSISEGVHLVVAQVLNPNTMTRLDGEDFCKQARQADAVLGQILREHYAALENHPQHFNERSAMIASSRRTSAVR